MKKLYYTLFMLTFFTLQLVAQERAQRLVLAEEFSGAW